MGLGDVGAGGGAGVAGHGRSVLCRFLSCDLGHLLGGCEGPKGSGSEGLRHGWGWGRARGELQIPLEEPLPTWAPASLGLAPRVQAARRSVLHPQSQRPRPLPRRSLSYRKQLERGRPESHSEMRLVVPGPVLASRPKDPMGTLIWCHVSVPPPGRAGGMCAGFRASLVCTRLCACVLAQCLLCVAAWGSLRRGPGDSWPSCPGRALPCGRAGAARASPLLP